MSENTSNLESALLYAACGYRVMPLHTPDAEGRCSCHKANCDSVGKHPRTMDGLTGATIDEAIIRKWWAQWPEANIAIVTGAESGVVVLDIDPRHGGRESLTKLLDTHGELVEKVYAHTGGGGWHILFRHPAFRVRNSQNKPERLGAGIDVRGDGGYIVAPPSLHASGLAYRWGTQFQLLPEMPQWLRTKLAEQPTTNVVFAGDGGEIPDGRRNDTLTSLAGTMRRRGMSEEAIYVALCVENEQKCRPPFPDDKVRKVAHSVARYAPDDPVCVYPERVTMDGERPDGIYFVESIYERIDTLYEQGMKGGVTTGWPSLDWFYTIKLGQWTVVTGIPGAGKSAVLDALLVNLVKLHGWSFCITSVENQPLERHAATLMAIWAQQPFGEGSVRRMDRATRDAAKAWLNEHFVFILPDEGGCTVGGILDRVSWVKEQRAVQGIIIDPWNELEHRRPAAMTETEYVSQSLSRLRRFARQEETHLWLVAHPTKLQKEGGSGKYPVPTLYDISGSAHFRNKADFGLSVWREVTDERSATEIHVQKVRFRECGRLGKCDLYFDVVTGQYAEQRPDYRQYVAEEESADDLTW